MEEVEKSIIRRRKAELVSSLEVSKELLQELRSCGVLTPESVATIEADRITTNSNTQRAGKLIDTMLLQSTVSLSEVFTNLLRVLSGALVNGDCRKLAKEMETELGLEKGLIHPRKEMANDAAALVHRKFGQSKRFSEQDKKDVSELVAVKLQLAHDDWRREADRIQAELERVRAEIQARDEGALKIASLLREFARKHEKQLVSHAHDMVTTREMIRKMMEPPRSDVALHQLDQNLRSFFRQVEHVLNERDSLYHEKEKCLHLMGVENESKVQLDEIVGKFTGMSVNPDGSVEKKDSVIARLRKQVDDLEAEVGDYEKKLKDYGKQLRSKEREIADLRHQIHID